MKPGSFGTLFAAILIAGLFVGSAFSAEMSGWIKSESCRVFEKPSTDSKITGSLKQKAGVTAEEAGQGWLKIVFAPVRDPRSGDYIDCKDCYIRKADVTDIDPCKW